METPANPTAPLTPTQVADALDNYAAGRSYNGAALREADVMLNQPRLAMWQAEHAIQASKGTLAHNMALQGAAMAVRALHAARARKATQAQVAAILAGLRLLQREIEETETDDAPGAPRNYDILEIWNDAGQVDGLDAAGIEELRDTINHRDVLL